MLSVIPAQTDDRVLVDFRTSDDAGVYRWEGGPALVHQLLVYPNTDHQAGTDSMRDMTDQHFFNPAAVEWYWGLYLASPELLAFCIFGLSMVAVLSGKAPLKGLAAAGQRRSDLSRHRRSGFGASRPR